MSITKSINYLVLDQFDVISLDALNHKAPMLVRLDNKYIVSSAVLKKALPTFNQHFQALEINHKNCFNYDTCYFDDKDLTSYFSHHNGRRQRVKIRTRRYNDINQCFLEMKIKDTRGITVKKRLACELDAYGKLSDHQLSYIRQTYWDFYRKDLNSSFLPTLNIQYFRSTLVAKNTDERVTIDHGIHFSTTKNTFETPEDIFVIETKSKNGNGIADKILRKFHQHPITNCSKYCLGLCVTKSVPRINNFLPALRKLTHYQLDPIRV